MINVYDDDDDDDDDDGGDDDDTCTTSGSCPIPSSTIVNACSSNDANAPNATNI